jgi:hypothetical protein
VEHGPGGPCAACWGPATGFREEWGRQMLRREVRVADSALIGNLMQNVSSPTPPST